MDKTPAIRIDNDSLLAVKAYADQANDLYLAAFRARYTPGARVSWIYGSRDEVQHGRVVTAGTMGDRLEVRNDEGGAVYWIHGWRVLDAMRREAGR